MEKSSDVKLLGSSWSSPYVNRVQFALNLKSVNHEFIVENMSNRSELLLKSNPVHKKIPVLIHGDEPICESLIIVEYIDETWTDAPSILSSDPYDRAMSRFWAAYIEDKWIPLLWDLTKAEGEEAKVAQLEKIQGGLMPLEDAFVKSSKGKAFFGGDTIGYLDIALGGHLGWLRAIQVMANVKILDETKTPGLVRWAETLLSDEAAKDVVPEPEILIEFLGMIEVMSKAAMK